MHTYYQIGNIMVKAILLMRSKPYLQVHQLHYIPEVGQGLHQQGFYHMAIFCRSHDKEDWFGLTGSTNLSSSLQRWDMVCFFSGKLLALVVVHSFFLFQLRLIYGYSWCRDFLYFTIPGQLFSNRNHFVSEIRNLFPSESVLRQTLMLAFIYYSTIMELLITYNLVIKHKFKCLSPHTLNEHGLSSK